VVGRTNIEDALGQLDQLTEEAVQMAAAQRLKATYADQSPDQSRSSIVIQVHWPHLTLLSQWISYERTSETASLPGIHL